MTLSNAGHRRYSLGIQPKIIPSISELSELIAHKVPAVTLGITEASNIQDLNETIQIEPIYKGLAQLLGTLLAIDGGFCNESEYEKFMVQVPEFEHMLYEDGVRIVKFWFSISREVQLARFESRVKNPLKRWKFSPVDRKGQELWDKYTTYKEQMFSKSHTSFCPWIIVKANSKKQARLESIRYVLNMFNYEGKDLAKVTLLHDPNVVMRYHRSVLQIDL